MQKLESAEPPIALPILARYSRAAPGWIRTLIGACMRLALAWVLVCVLFFPIGGSLVYGLLLNVESLLAEATNLPRWTWLGPALVGTAVTLWRSSGARQLLCAPWSPPGDVPLHPIVGAAARAVDWVGRGLTLCGAAILLTFTWIPIGLSLALLGVAVIHFVIDALLSARFPESLFDWRTGLAIGSVGVAIGLPVLIIRKRGALRFILGLFWLLGVGMFYLFIRERWVIWQPDWKIPAPPAWALTTPWWDLRPFFVEAHAVLLGGIQYPNIAIYAALAMALIYPLGVGLPAAGILRWPTDLLKSAVLRVANVFDLRRAIHRAVRQQERRNQERLGGRPYWMALSEPGLRRFVTSTAQLSYFRWTTYAHAPDAQADQPAFTGVVCRAVHFDNSMTEPLTQVGATLRLNGRQMTDGRATDQDWEFDAITIGAAGDHDVEMFITECINRRKTLGQVSVHVLPGHSIGKNLEPILRENCEALFHGTTPNPNGCTPLHTERLHKAAQQRQRQQAVFHLRQPVILAAVALALLWMAPTLGPLLTASLTDWIADILPGPVEGSTSDGPTDVSGGGNRTTAFTGATEETVGVTSTPQTNTRAESGLTPSQSSLVGVDGMPLLRVPEGAFRMGNPDGRTAERTADEAPAHEVSLSAFYIDAYEISRAQYARCVQAGACRAPSLEGADDNLPVVGVKWDDAATYCAWVGRRLPTEAEWEKAARWDPATGAVRPYPWGAQEPSDERLSFKGRAGLRPVQDYPAGRSAVGAHQMAGNVWEWTADWYAPYYYAQSESHNPAGPPRGAQRVARGGGWDSTAFQVRSSNRFELSPAATADNLGFRCAQDVP